MLSSMAKVSSFLLVGTWWGASSSALLARPACAIRRPLVLPLQHRHHRRATSMASTTASNVNRTPRRRLHDGPSGSSSASPSSSSSSAGKAAVGLRGGLVVAPPLMRAVKVMAGMNLLGFAVSLATKWHYHLDLIGTGAFVVSALASHRAAASAVASAPRQVLMTGLVATWGSRLAGFLFYRALQYKNDARLDDLLDTTGGAATFWGLSYVWGQLVILPQALALSARGANQVVRLGPGGVACGALAAAGIAIEATADWQKFAFKKENPGKLCDVGLWGASQHPNYLGELMMWYGIFGLSAPVLWQTSSAATGLLRYLPAPTKALALAAAGPAFLTLLLTGQANGEIGNAKELAAKKWAGDAKYEAYQRDTPVLVPKLF